MDDDRVEIDNDYSGIDEPNRFLKFAVGAAAVMILLAGLILFTITQIGYAGK